MKRFFSDVREILFTTVIFVMISQMQCFAYTKTVEWQWKVADNTYYPMPYIETTDYITRNGTAMVKFRNMVNVMGGSVEYIASSKTTKAYFPIGLKTQSVAIKAGNKAIDFTDRIEYLYTKNYSRHYANPAPVIINGSLYVSAIDLGNVMAKDRVCPLLDNKYADIRNGKLYIAYAYNTQG